MDASSTGAHELVSPSHPVGGAAIGEDDIIRSGGCYGYRDLGDPLRLKHVIVDRLPAYALIEGLYKETGWGPSDPVPREGDEGVRRVRCVIRELPFMIGRTNSKTEEIEIKNNCLNFPSKRISSLHAVIDFNRGKGAWMIECHGKNGLLLNRQELRGESNENEKEKDRRPRKAALPSGSSFRIGPFFGFFALPADTVGKGPGAPGIGRPEQQQFWQSLGVKLPPSTTVSTPAAGLFAPPPRLSSLTTPAPGSTSALIAAQVAVAAAAERIKTEPQPDEPTPAPTAGAGAGMDVDEPQ